MAQRQHFEETRVARGACRFLGDPLLALKFRSVFYIGTLHHINEIELLVLSIAAGFQLLP
jgi:hypothetical protein